VDTLTHALSGALLARAIPPVGRGSALTPRARAVTAFCAAAFPDTDYLYYLVDRLQYLNVHQGITHSLALLPLWALLLAVAAARLSGGHWRAYAGACALGLAAHVAGDLLTTYGVQLLAPFSDKRWSLRTTFVIDPYLSAVVVAGLAASWRLRPRRAPAVAALAVLALYVGQQARWQHQALDVARAYATAETLHASAVHALPQPFLPTNWKLVVATREAYHEAHLRLAPSDPWRLVLPRDSRLARVAAAYRAPAALRWTRHARIGAQPRHAALWAHPALAGFRRFARLPVPYRGSATPDADCVWFTDLRYTLPAVPPFFRYGLCRAAAGDVWRPYRLRFLSEGARQPL